MHIMFTFLVLEKYNKPIKTHFLKEDTNPNTATTRQYSCSWSNQTHNSLAN